MSLRWLLLLLLLLLFHLHLRLLGQGCPAQVWSGASS
jgi:hypothetical protein